MDEETNQTPIPIGIIGDHDASRASHVATEAALDHAAGALGVRVEPRWLAMRTSSRWRVAGCAAFVVAPGGPYEGVDHALRAIRTAREEGMPVLGTCGGFQHVVLEFARHVLGLESAQHAEYAPHAPDLVIAPLTCSLVGRRATVHLEPGTRASAFYAAAFATEEYRCSFGIAAPYVADLERAGLVVSGVDDAGEARIVELRGQPFYLATLFVPQLSSRPERPHPLFRALVAAAMRTAREGDAAAPNHLLITGMSGVGKSTVLDELRARGLACIDMDDEALSYLDDEGHQHWRTDALVELLDAHPERTTFVFGCAEEQGSVYDRFGAIVLLSAPVEVMVDRVRSRAGNSFGRDPSEMARILADQRAVEPSLRASCTHEIVTTLPVVEVVDRILAIANRRGDALRADQDRRP